MEREQKRPLLARLLSHFLTISLQTPLIL